MWQSNNITFMSLYLIARVFHCFSLSSDYWEAMSKVRNVDVNVVSGTLKLYLRELPEPLIPAAYFQSLSKAMGEFPALSFPQSFHLPHTHTQTDLFVYLKQIWLTQISERAPCCLSCDPSLTSIATHFSSSYITLKGNFLFSNYIHSYKTMFILLMQ